MARANIPDIVIGRLPLYLRALVRMQQEGLSITSSYDLSRKLGISSAQIRKDLSHFGEFGKQGTGYNVNSLIFELQRILHIDKEWSVALVGIGDLGRALVHYGGFSTRGFRITHLFDNDQSKVGQTVNNLKILPAANIESVLKKTNTRVAMIATPADDAQAVADVLIHSGIQAILNYAPIVLSVPEGIRVQYIDPVVHMQRMVYYLG